MFEQVAQKRMETMSETNVVHFLGHPVYNELVYIMIVSHSSSQREKSSKKVSNLRFLFST